MAVKVTGQFEPAGSFSIVDGKDISGNITGSNISASGTGIFNKLEVRGADGTLAADYIIHTDDENTKFGFPSNDTFKIRTSGTDRLHINSSGQVGIGTSTQNNALQVVGNISASEYVYAQNMQVGSDSVYITGASGSITASGHISASGTIIAATASIQLLNVAGGVFTSASLAGGGVSDYTQLSNIPTGIISGSDHVFTSITSSGNISASTTSTGSFGTVFSYKSEIQADGTNPAFLISSASLNTLTVNDEGILELGSFTFTPSATAGGMYYNSVDNEFYFGKT